MAAIGPPFFLLPPELQGVPKKNLLCEQPPRGPPKRRQTLFVHGLALDEGLDVSRAKASLTAPRGHRDRTVFKLARQRKEGSAASCARITPRPADLSFASGSLRAARRAAGGRPLGRPLGFASGPLGAWSGRPLGRPLDVTGGPLGASGTCPLRTRPHGRADQCDDADDRGENRSNQTERGSSFHHFPRVTTIRIARMIKNAVTPPPT